MIALTNLDGSNVKIEAGSVNNGYANGTGTIADVHAIGFNVVDENGTIKTDIVNGVALSDNELLVNDVLIGKSAGGSAGQVADINAKSAEHGVTASAKNEVRLDIDLANIPGTLLVLQLMETLLI